MRTIIGITGASGGAVAVEFIKRCPGEKILVMSRWGKAVLQQETVLTSQDLAPLVTTIFSNDDLNAPLASGSIPFDHYIVLPCSITTLGRLACGIGENLITRIGEVALKGLSQPVAIYNVPLTDGHAALRVIEGGAPSA